MEKGLKIVTSYLNFFLWDR